MMEMELWEEMAMPRRSVFSTTRQSLNITWGLCALAALGLGTGCHAAEQGNSTEAKWISLFNGKDLTGWTPKFTAASWA